MATYCPNPTCGRKLTLKDWRVNCPECGVNIIYYKMDERLLADADKVEMEHVEFQKKADRAKAATIGDKWAIARLVLLLLPVAPLFLPLVKTAVNVPFLEIAGKDGSANIVSIIMYFIDGLNFDVIFGLLGTDSFGTAIIWFLVGILGLALVLVCFLMGLVTCFLAASPRGFQRAVVINGLGMLGAAIGMLGVTQYGAQMDTLLSGAIQSAAGIGGYFVIAAFAVILAFNIVIKARGGIPVQYKQCYVSGFPAEEVQAALAKGKTLDEMRAERDAMADTASEAEATEE